MDERAEENDHDPSASSPDPVHHDLLDEPALPLFGLSASTIAAIAIGGTLGTLARYLFEVHHPVAEAHFPWVTLVVNLSGSLAIGFLIPLTERASDRAPALRPLLVIGLLGGWTTYSTVAVEATLLLRHGAVGTCLAYLTATVAGGLVLVVVGHDLGQRATAR